MKYFGPEASQLNQAVLNDDPETARNLLKAAGNSCTAIDLVERAIKMESNGLQLSLDELDANSDRLSLSRKTRTDTVSSSLSSLPVVSIIIDRCKR